MEPETRIIECLGLELVEFLVLLFGDVVFVFKPDRTDGVEGLAIDFDGELHEGGIFFDDLFDPVFFREVFILLF